MVLREELEALEFERLAPGAAKAAASLGREEEEEPCELRTAFQRDRDRIIHSKSFRRLMHKTQVFIAPEGDHFSTRLTHPLEVSQIASTIARALRLNEDLTEAIALGHDLGHTPFGHMGEYYLNEKHPGGFEHNIQSLRVVDRIERRVSGHRLNLTAEVRDGIKNHTGDIKPFTLEGQIVRLTDRIAYINHDIDDAIRAGLIKDEDLPADCVDWLGPGRSSRINTLVLDCVNNSDGEPEIKLSEEGAYYMDRLRSFMFEKVYNNPVVRNDSDMVKIKNMIYTLYDFYLEHPEEMPQLHRSMLEEDGAHEVVKDMIAGMTDRYAISDYMRRFVPKGWKFNG